MFVDEGAANACVTRNAGLSSNGRNSSSIYFLFSLTFLRLESAEYREPAGFIIVPE